MPWVDETQTVGLAEGSFTQAVEQKTKELHRAYLARTDGPQIQVCFVRLWGSNDGTTWATAWDEEWPMDVGVPRITFPIFGYRFFRISIFTPPGSDDAVVDVDLSGDGGVE